MLSNVIVLPYLAIVPLFSVSLTGTSVPLIGQSLTLKCMARVTSDISVDTSDITFDIIWTMNATEVRRVKNLSFSLLDGYSDSYTISEVSTSLTNSSYACRIIVNIDQPIVRTSDTFFAYEISKFS